jgi:hypothetical protein
MLSRSFFVAGVTLGIKSVRSSTETATVRRQKAAAARGLSLQQNAAAAIPAEATASREIELGVEEGQRGRITTSRSKQARVETWHHRQTLQISGRRCRVPLPLRTLHLA